MNFPPDFIWGSATASYQIEGAAFEDGKKASVWDMFCRKPGAVWKGQSGELACDHYHRYQEDVALMKTIGLKAYRFSVSWPRVLPDGVGRVNPKGLDFYDRLVDELLTAGIEPYATLFHWDFPYALYLQGGWLNPSSPDWMAEYTRVVVDRLSDRVSSWMPLNEPAVFIWLGLHDGIHAPGDRLGLSEVLQAAHHTLVAGGRSVQVIRETAKTPPQVGMALNGSFTYPASDSNADIEAARTAMFSYKRRNLFTFSFWADPLIKGHYPEEALQAFEEWLPDVKPQDLEDIHQPLDYFGFNVYFGDPVKAGTDGQPVMLDHPQGHPLNSLYWPVTPEALYWGLRFLWDRYQLPLMITENGMANTDWVSLDDQVHDPQRIDFTRRYLLALDRALGEGIPVKGYFHWSLMDNFEWSEGYRQRFGLVYVDYPTQKRVPKDSALWYREVIASNGASLTQNR